MNDHDISRLSTHLHRIEEERVERGLVRLRDRLSSPQHSLRRGKWLIPVATIGIAASIAIPLLKRPPAQPEFSAGVPNSSPLLTNLVIDEGTSLQFPSGTKIRVSEQTASRVVVILQSGAARFQVKHNPKRLFRVEAGPIRIDDMGTRFRVDHEAAGLRVSVTEGEVAISFPLGSSGVRGMARLQAGESGLYASTTSEPVSDSLPTEAASVVGKTADLSATDRTASRPSKRVSEPLRDSPGESWRALANTRNYDEAFRILSRSGFRGVRDEPADLLLAADVARLSHHPAASVGPLSGLLRRHANDARAPAAAFSLGWILMNDLHRPAEAAAAFTSAERLAPRGNLAEDAAARAVEAWHTAKDFSRARMEFDRYKQTYPMGRHERLLARLIDRG